MIKTSSKIFFGFILLFVAIFTGVAVGEIYLENTRSCSADVSSYNGYSEVSSVNFDVFRSNVTTTAPITFLVDYIIIKPESYGSDNSTTNLSTSISILTESYTYSNNTLNSNNNFIHTSQNNFTFNSTSDTLIVSNTQLRFYYGDNLDQLSSSYYVYYFMTYTRGSVNGIGTPIYVQYGYMNQNDGSTSFPYYYATLPNSNALYFYISFVDSNNCAITYYFGTGLPRNSWNYMVFDNIYYSHTADQSSIDYNSGLNTGTSTGYNNGYNVGRSDGYNVGYTVGYSDGVADDNDYTFVGLISAVIDVPVTTFTSLFNFDILGVNLKDFLLGLFGIAIVVTIIRFVLVK